MEKKDCEHCIFFGGCVASGWSFDECGLFSKKPDDYKQIAQQALNEPDPKQALELYEKAREVAKEGGFLNNANDRS